MFQRQQVTTTEETRQCTGTLAHAGPNWTLELLRPRVVHGGIMKCRHKPRSFQKHHELFPTSTGVMRCLAQPLQGYTTIKRASDPTTRPYWLHTHTHLPRRLAHPRSPIPPLSTLTARATHARPLHPAALASVPYRTVLVRVRVHHQGPWSRRHGPYGAEGDPGVVDHPWPRGKPPQTRTRTNTGPYGTETNAAGRNGRACVARAVSVERGGMG